MSKKSDPSVPNLINEKNLSYAWAKAFLFAKQNSGTEISPLIISISGFDQSGAPTEDLRLRAALDKALSAKNRRSIENVAFTIFPQRLWQIAQGDRNALFRMYMDAYPRYVARNKSGNSRGLYFQRLITQGPESTQGNQLEWILSQFEARAGVRDSMFQASIFDPSRDHTSTAQLQFPCLQHVSFDRTKKGLVLNSFYATQKLFSKAYGNYLGLSQLGAFMAHEMGIQLARVNVFIGVEKLDEYPKSDPVYDPLVEIANEAVKESK
ncbi:thymidylate synthase [Delftia sp. HK171]|uniref:thymidylate synthase n=1 Tax=Delftia sp. HK171 TaxID=1920191 RepID=UPI000903C92B|nr:thymidylate synthase [Delftia sp. HK171]APE51566.1 thymidylate synthase [Delftia sp. HK171]